ncbi:hypothetical protein NEOLEDRAFT_634033 [Neolentinus lepideus HHB14362 ss-1]|uniref:DUF6533 domain-containing protein n=1 Tax=Neolentinus lepideus HHB14362 ss-1 TaxID=1314782 RepID=A0A165QMD0_9AGAM|nr:hypothetical protein NEOLEDRAFT_634033 [Neolentinus lepideus HHB14362 ss-1]
MNSTSSADTQHEINLEGIAVRRARHVAYSLFIMVMYEYLITLDWEVAYYWSGRTTLSRILFLLSPYHLVRIGISPSRLAVSVFMVRIS